MEWNYNILEEVRAFVDRTPQVEWKPQYVPDSVFETASAELRRFLVEIDKLLARLNNAYWEAVSDKDWIRASVIHQLLNPPDLGCISAEICEWYNCKKWKERSLDCGLMWIVFAMELLTLPDHHSSP